MIEALCAYSVKRLKIHTHATCAKRSKAEKPSQNPCGKIGNKMIAELYATTAVGLAAPRSIAKHVRFADPKHAKRPRKEVIVRMP